MIVCGDYYYSTKWWIEQFVRKFCPALAEAWVPTYAGGLVICSEIYFLPLLQMTLLTLIATLCLQAESLNNILSEDTQPVIRAIGELHTACKDECRQNLPSHNWSVFIYIFNKENSTFTIISVWLRSRGKTNPPATPSKLTRAVVGVCGNVANSDKKRKIKKNVHGTHEYQRQRGNDAQTVEHSAARC